MTLFSSEFLYAQFSRTKGTKTKPPGPWEIRPNHIDSKPDFMLACCENLNQRKSRTEHAVFRFPTTALEQVTSGSEVEPCS